MAADELALLHGHAGMEVEELHEVPVVLLSQRPEDVRAGGQDFDVVFEDDAPRSVGLQEGFHGLEVAEVAADFARARQVEAVAPGVGREVDELLPCRDFLTDDRGRRSKGRPAFPGWRGLTPCVRRHGPG
jgi:hypothetical protein